MVLVAGLAWASRRLLGCRLARASRPACGQLGCGGSAEVIVGIMIGPRRPPEAERVTGDSPAPGAAACPLPWTGSPPVAGAAARSAVPAPAGGRLGVPNAAR